jgi:hypothetical protein
MPRFGLMTLVPCSGGRSTPLSAKFAGNLRNLIYAFGGIEVLEELEGDKAHRLSNGLTLEINVHSLFDSLDLWFEEDLVSAILFHG